MIRTSIIFAAICCAALWWAAGDSLGIWLGGFGVVALLVPVLPTEKKRLLHRLAVVGIVCAFVLIGWVISTIRTEVRMSEFLSSAILLAAFAWACFGLILLLEACRLPPSVCTLFITLAAAAWLTSPVWMSQWMNESRAAFLSDYQPLLVVNGQVKSLGIWLEQPHIYRHVVLGQDVPYALATSIWKSAVFHGVVGGIGTIILRVTGAQRAKKVEAIEE